MEFVNQTIMKPCFSAYLSFIALLIACPGFSEQKHPERWYQEKWCDERNGRTEVVLPDRTRCDCVTETHAIEFDFANKWAEAIGQALHYSRMTGKRAGVVLILESEKDKACLERLNDIVEHFNLPIDVWIYIAGGES